MIKYIIDDSFDGILTAVYYSYTNKENVLEVLTSSAQLSILDEIKIIKTDYDFSSKVNTRLKKIMKLNSYRELKLSLRSGERDKLTTIFNYVVFTLDNQTDCSTNFLNPTVQRFSEIVYKIKHEIHRFTGFIRFQKTPQGIYYAHFKPDNNICDLLLPHFKKRYGKMPMIFHDTRYNVICAYNGVDTKIVNKELPPLTVKDDVISLFKEYYQTINIESRRNVKLMRNYMPKRYAKFMSETHDFDKLQ